MKKKRNTPKTKLKTREKSGTKLKSEKTKVKQNIKLGHE